MLHQRELGRPCIHQQFCLPLLRPQPLEMVNQICELAVICSDEELQKISWTEFVTKLDESTCSELITYLKERRLYVNPPVTDEEDE